MPITPPASQSGSEPTPAAAANDPLAVWTPVLPTVVGNHLQLGMVKQPGKFLLHLSFSGSLTVSLDAEGRILLLIWTAGAEGFSGEGFAAGMAKQELPLLLLRNKAEAVLLTDRTTFLVGENGVAIIKANQEIEFIRAEDIHGVALCAQPDLAANE